MWYNSSWGSTLLFKARTNSLEVNEKRKKWGEEKDTYKECGVKRERYIETLEHVFTKFEEY